MPVTTPVGLTLATAALLLLHVPPVVALLRVVVLPAHTFIVPVITPADEPVLTVMVLVAVVVPQLLTTV